MSQPPEIKHDQTPHKKILGLGESSLKNKDFAKLLSQEDKHQLQAVEKQDAERQRQKIYQAFHEKTLEMEKLLQTVSHDLRTPLINVSGFSSEVLNDCKHLAATLDNIALNESDRHKINRILHESLPESVGYIIRSVNKMNSLLNALNTLSQAGHIDFNIRKIDMNEVIRNITATVTFQARERGIKIDVSPLPTCFGDEVQINQVFTNLIGNAMKYLCPDRPGHIRIEGRQENNKSIYSIADNGLGISPDQQDNVFKLFYRVPTDKKIKGEGLGLTIAKQIIDRHHGQIWLESEPNKGTTFHIALQAGEEITNETK